jgi:PAS domain S-box-containing protein
MTDPDRTAVRRRRRWLGLAAAIALPAIAVLLSRAFLPYIANTQFIFFFPAVAAAAWLGGLPAGLLATLVAVGLADYFVIPPRHVLLPLAFGDAMRLGLFAAFSLVISRLSDMLTRARDEAEDLAASLTVREEHLKEQLEEGQALTEELEEANERLQHANSELQRTQARRDHLFRLAARLSEATTPHDVAEVMFRDGLRSVGADAGSLGLLQEDADGSLFVHLSHSQGYSQDTTAKYERFPLTPGRPVSDALTTRQPVLISGSAVWEVRYPDTAAIVRPMGYEAFAALPIVLGDRAVASVSFSFREAQQFDDDARVFMETMARVCSQALERARAYEAEMRAHERANVIVESIADGFVAFDSALRFTYVNGRASEMWDKPASELIGLTPQEAFADNADSPIITFLTRALQESRVATLEEYAPTLRRWIEMRVYPSADGGLVAFFQDVTARRRSQEAAAFLAEASQLLTASSNYSETLTNLAHAAVPRLGDWCAVDILDDPLSTAWPPDLRRVAVVHQDPVKIALGAEMTRSYPTDWSTDWGLPKVLREGTPMFVPVIVDEMLAASARDARHLELMRALQFNSIMAVPITARGRVLGVLTLCMTESGRRYVDADLALAEDLARRAGTAIDNARLLRDAETANATKTEFLRTISHELRQPLNATVSFLQLWELGLRGPLTQEQRDDLVRVQRNQRHLMSLIEDLLSFTRLEAGRLEVERDHVVMDDALQSLEAMIAPQMSAKGVSFTYQPCDRSLVALADRDRTVQICLNLLTNALRATPRGGRVHMECLGSGATISVVIADTGVGIPADKLESIFFPFTQLGRALNQPKEGAGLGLAISRGLAEAMGGTLTATSALGVGSTFILELPRA